MKLKIILAIAGTLLLLAFFFPSIPLKGVGFIEWRLLNGQSIKLYHEKKYPKALLVAKHSLKVAEEKIDPESLETAKSLNSLGLIYEGQVKYKKADAVYERSLAIKKKILKPDDPSLIISYRNIADLYLNQGYYSKAEAFNKHALKSQRKTLDPKHLSLAKTLNKLGEIYIHKKQYTKAKKHLKESLTIRENKLGQEHNDVATSLNNLAVLYYFEGDYSKAETLHKRVLSIRKKVLGPESSSVATSLNNLAAVYTKQGKYSEAEGYYLQTLKIWEKTHNPNDMSSILHNLGWLYYNQEKYKKSETYYLRALKITEKIFDPDHPSTLKTQKNLVSLYKKTNNVAEVKKLEEHIESLKVDKKTIQSKPIKKKIMVDNTQNEDLVPYFIPSLSAILTAAEKKKGTPLTKEEVLSIRDNSQTIMTPKSMIKTLSEKRGYKDIDPENCWNEWLLLRPDLGLEPIKDGGAMIIKNPSGVPQMKQAEIKANKTLGEFRELLKQYPKAPALIKANITETNTSARMWLLVDKDNKDSFSAHLFEAPTDFQEHQENDSFTIKNKDVLDWMLNNNGDTYGAYTIRIQRESMTEKEKEKLDNYMGIKKYL